MEQDNADRREFLASYQQYKDFISSVIWQDMQIELQEWIDDLHNSLEQEVPPEVYRYQGRVQACKQFLNLPQRILAVLEVEHERKSKNADEGAYPIDAVQKDVDALLAQQELFYTTQLTRWISADPQGDS